MIWPNEIFVFALFVYTSCSEKKVSVLHSALKIENSVGVITNVCASGCTITPKGKFNQKLNCATSQY